MSPDDRKIKSYRRGLIRRCTTHALSSFNPGVACNLKADIHSSWLMSSPNTIPSPLPLRIGFSMNSFFSPGEPSQECTSRPSSREPGSIVSATPFSKICACVGVRTWRATREGISCFTIPSIRLSWTRRIVLMSLKHRRLTSRRISASSAKSSRWRSSRPTW